MIPVIGVTIWPVIKVLVLIILALYIFFAIVVIRQVQLMTDTLEVGFELQLKIFSIIHLLVAIGVLAFAFLIL